MHLPESKQESGLRLAPSAPRSIPMKRIAAAEQTREQLRALLDGPKEHPDEENSRSRADTRAASRLA